MFTSAKIYLGKALTGPPNAPAPAPSRSATVTKWTVAAGLGLWIFGYKMLCFLGLETTSDVYSCVQLATSWIRGDFLYDNFFGNQLATHTFLIAPFLSVLAWPFGAVGLFLAVGLALAATFLALVRLLRLLQVPGDIALIFALIVSAMPLAVHTYQDIVYGFHYELLEPALALWLTYFLLRREWAGSCTTALLLILVKEDAALLVAVVAAIVLSEDWFRADRPNLRTRLNVPAAAALLVAILAVPLLLLLLKSHQVPGAPGNLARLHPLGAPTITNHRELFSYVFGHLDTWLRSAPVLTWLGLSVAGTFGLIAFRPHLLVVGLATTLIAWLVQDDLMWAPRFVQALAFFQITACLAFASVWRLHLHVGAGPTRPTLTGAVLGLGLLGAVALGVRYQQTAAPLTGEVYRLRPLFRLSSADRQKADRVFAVYRRESRPDEPVIASDFLFRYAHDRNLLWYNRLRGRPPARWILWDLNDRPLSVLEGFLRADAGSSLTDFEPVAEVDRFVLLKRRAGKN